ncbi:MAG: DNA repair protein RecO [Halioglobus sp.]
MRVSLQPAYILHSRPYRDSSLLLEAFTPEHGRISLAARGARRRSRGGSHSALLRPFVPLLLSFSGRGELKSLVATEAAGSAPALLGDRLFSGLYLNELLVRLLHRHDAHPQLFAAYSDALAQLPVAEPMEGVLRRFELSLLTELGYSFDIAVDCRSGDAMQADRWYCYEPGHGLTALPAQASPAADAYAGADLLAIAAGDLCGSARVACKRLLREALAEYLGQAPLRSRDLFQRAKQARVALDGQGEGAG